MDLVSAKKLTQEMIDKHIPGTIFRKFNARKSSCGRAIINRTNGIITEYIELSKHYVLTSSEENIKNTIAHECAHILAYRMYGTLDHDYAFYKACEITGAKQERINKDPAVKAAMQGIYRMVLIEDGEVKCIYNNSWHKRPRKDLSECWINGQDRSTMGKLFYCKVDDAIEGTKFDTKKYWQK